MRTQLLQSLLVLLCLPFFAIGQDCFDEILPNGGDCNSAVFLCGSEFDCYMGSLPSTPTDTTMGTHPEDLCNNAGDIDNIQWFSFIPCESSIELDIIPLSCTAVLSSLFGLQTGIYEDCSFGTPLFCYSDQGVATINITLDDLVPGNIYYLFVDGYAGSICDYKFDVISGIDTSTPVQPDSVDVDITATNTTICEGDDIKASFDVPDLNIGGFSCGNITGEDLDYVACFEWEITGTPTDGTIALEDAYDIIDGESSACTQVIFYEAGNYIVNTNAEFNPAVFGGANSCTVADVNFTPVAITVEERVLEVLPQIEVCQGDSYTYCDSTYLTDVVVECVVGCTTFVQPIVFNESTLIDLGTFFVCEGECFLFEDVEYCNPDFYEISDSETCTTSTFAIATLDETVDYGLEDEINCDIAMITLSPSYTINNNEPLNYQWTNDNNELLGTTPTIDITEEGNYTVVVTADDIAAGCIISHTIVITESSEQPELSIEPPIITCDDPMGLITLSSDMDIATADWTGPGTFDSDEISPMVSDTGIYEVTIIAANGCTTIEQIRVSGDIKEPVIMPAYRDIDCNIQEVEASYTADVAIRSQEWTGPGLSSSAEMIMTSTAGMYTLTVTAFNGCTATENFEIKDVKDWPSIDVGPDQLWNCNTEEIAINAMVSSMGPYSYEWNVINGDPLNIVDEANVIATTIGEYELVVTNTEVGCVTRDTINITTNEDIPTAVIGEAVDPMCFYEDNGYILIESVTGGAAPYSMAVNGEAVVEAVPLENLADGVYDLLVTDNNGCEYSQVIELVKPAAITLTAPDEVMIKYYATGVLELEYSIDDSEVAEINWYNADGNRIGEGSSLEFEERISTNYTVELISVDGCIVEQEISIRVDTSVEIYVPNVFSPNGDGNNDIFWVQGEDEDVMIESLLIFDRWGNKVYEAKDMPVGEVSRGWDGNYNAQPVNPGVYVYMLEVRTADNQIIVESGDVTVVR